MARAPLIGLSGRRLQSSVVHGMDARFARTDADLFFTAYAACIDAAGGIPVYLPAEAARLVVDRLDGLVITGGQDLHPSAWGGPRPDSRDQEAARLDLYASDPERDSHELALVRAAAESGVPTLGVCRGAQLLNVAFGGSLHEDLEITSVIHNSAAAAPDDGSDAHLVRFAPGSVLESLYGPERAVNSWHHQAVRECGQGLTAAAWAQDGVIEGIEIPGRPVIGVQWHPEWQMTTDPIFGWLVARSSER